MDEVSRLKAYVLLEEPQKNLLPTAEEFQLVRIRVSVENDNQGHL